MAGARISQTTDDLKEQLREQLDFLRRSCDAFDLGMTDEAKRLAVSLRILHHDAGRSRSLLGQLGLLDRVFLSTAHAPEPGNKLTHMGLLMMAIGDGGAEYAAPLDEGLEARHLLFDAWWNEVVFIDDRRAVLSRKALILAVSNQDGGAHVDPALDETYARLSRHNSLSWVEMPTNRALRNPERYSVRQIAHETLRSLDTTYSKVIERKTGVLAYGAVLHEDESPNHMKQMPRVGRNAACPCGSGLKFKRCHGRPM